MRGSFADIVPAPLGLSTVDGPSRDAQKAGGQGLVSTGLAHGGLDHLALICSDMDATIGFYIDVLKMRLEKVVTNRDDPTSTHVFLDMGGGNMLAFFDFPEHGPAPVQRGIGAMHHVALKADAKKYQAIIETLRVRQIDHSVHGSKEAGSVYFRDPDNIPLEVTTGYSPL